MIQPDLSREVRLTIPARQDYALVASMTLCGLGMAAGLDMDLLGDLRTVTCESWTACSIRPAAPNGSRYAHA